MAFRCFFSDENQLLLIVGTKVVKIGQKRVTLQENFAIKTEFKETMNEFEEKLHGDLHQFLLSMKEVDERLPECPDVEDKWEAFNAYVACLHQLYLMGAAMQLKRMGYHMTKMS